MRKVFGPIGLTALAVVLCWVPLVRAADALLEDFVASGRLAGKVLETVDRIGRSEALLVIRSDDIRSAVLSPAGRMGGMAERRQRYAARKSAVFERTSPADVTLLQDYEHLPLAYVEVTAAGLDDLLADGEVAAVAENAVLYPTLAQSLPLISAGIAHLDGYTGEGTTVAVLDTGVEYTRSAFGPCSAPGVPAGICKVLYAQDFWMDDGQWLDDGQLDAASNKHGTNVAGIVLGVAPDTGILALDVFRPGGGVYSDVLLALNWVLGNKDVYHIASVNLSMEEPYTGYTAPCPNNPLAPAFSELKLEGILSAVASGNSGYTNKIAPPGCSPDAVSVGAVYDGGPVYGYTGCSETTTADKVVCFSNSAYFLSLLAPGAEIVAAGISLSGTSLAAPHVAGAAAVIKAAVPQIDVEDTVAVLRQSGKPVTDLRNGLVTPRINLSAAMETVQVRADFSAAPRAGTAPLSVAFSDLSAYWPTSWLWSFGDGGHDSVQNPVHQYLDPGLYTVSLAVGREDLSGDIRTQNDYITVYLNEAECDDPGSRARASNSGDLWFAATLQAAYETAAIEGDPLFPFVLDAYAVDLEEALTLNQPLQVVFGQGYGCGYTTAYMGLTLARLTVSAGSAVFDGLRVALQP